MVLLGDENISKPIGKRNDGASGRGRMNPSCKPVSAALLINVFNLIRKGSNSTLWLIVVDYG